MLVSKRQAFTLAELLAVVTISSILVSFAIPAYYDLLRNNAVRSDSEHLTAGFLTAKSEAITTEADVTICPFDAESGVSCISTSNWSSWVVFSGSSPNSLNADNIISVYNVDNTIFTSDSGITSITFRPTGFSSVGTTFAGQPDNCSTSKKYRREVTVNISGVISGERKLCIAPEE
ncbi:MAG: prepilin-type N-terminal cleavage/methylation domain-containing protein [Francisellaceae bacterium]|jgi:type IV fimbrial biogenesis protein FimT|nr:prepilin-type N-terminal cleavage/methylation domain-containing protein [Francisellaceae bacterium]MBT6206578.1 prepilin-type N-terminal cleavage/methylation domain-containing protein [Francisellaceae bacterium]MBT6538633.1 prepilin-type N-terminal cleavage/methylation domain-containing protein [Francisellaceae bacterium]